MDLRVQDILGFRIYLVYALKYTYGIYFDMVYSWDILGIFLGYSAQREDLSVKLQSHVIVVSVRMLSGIWGKEGPGDRVLRPPKLESGGCGTVGIFSP